MTTLREAAQQALEALDCPGKAKTADEQAAITALRAALAEPVQEPVAWMYHGMRHDGTPHDRPSLIWRPEHMDAMSADKGAKATPLYTAPPQRKPLTDEEIKACEQQAMVNGALPFEQRVFFARAIEQAHGIGTEARATLTKPCGSLGEEL